MKFKGKRERKKVERWEARSLLTGGKKVCKTGSQPVLVGLVVIFPVNIAR